MICVVIIINILLTAAKHLSAPRFPRGTRRIKQPYILFHDKSAREVWMKMIKEMEAGLLMAKS